MAIKTPTEVLTEPLKLFTEIENMVSISGLQKEQEKKKAKMAEAKWEKKKMSERMVGNEFRRIIRGQSKSLDLFWLETIEEFWGELW